jgi:UPF0755 protein
MVLFTNDKRLMNKMSSIKKTVVALSVVFFIAIVVAAAAFYNYLHTPLSSSSAAKTILIEPGSSLTATTKKLQKEGVLSCPRWLLIYARLTNRTMVHSGEYLVDMRMTPMQLLSAFNKGDVVRHQLTLVEGHTFRQALQSLAAEQKLQKKLKRFSEQELIKLLEIDHKHLEGLFFPDTYQYTIDMSDVDVLKASHKKLQQVLEEEWQSRDANLPYKNAYEALIMASIVEKETGASEERSAIAGVFVRRLQKGMRLQTDPTVIYGLGDSYKGNLTRKHLLADTPYNSYTRAGLPPTPIALAGREAIHAALHPQDGDSLYFVGKGDGHHYFSSTLAEHESAVRKYQLARSKNYRSSPAQVSSGAKQP